MKFELRKCELCDNVFEINIDNKQSNKKRFCSKKCSNKLKNLGRKHTEEWKKKMSIRNKGENNPFYGKKHSKESKNKMSKTSKWTEDKYKYCNMTDQEKEIFDGIMISDGSLNKSRISARITLGFKYIETIDRIISDLHSINFKNPWKYKSKPDKRTLKSYTNYFTKSTFYRDLLFEYNRWYKDKKIIPNDIKITPLMCYWWYVCDGFILNSNVYLCTDSFDKKSLLLIKNKLEKENFNVSIRSNNRIFFNKKSSIDFINYISNNINIQKEYLYKFELKNKEKI